MNEITVVKSNMLVTLSDTGRYWEVKPISSFPAHIQQGEVTRFFEKNKGRAIVGCVVNKDEEMLAGKFPMTSDGYVVVDCRKHSADSAQGSKAQEAKLPSKAQESILPYADWTVGKSAATIANQGGNRESRPVTNKILL